MTVTARAIALDVLIAIERDDAYANLLLPKRITSAGFDEQHAAFATELCYGTARNFGVYDWIISQVAGRPAAKIDALPLSALRLGAHQLLQMRVQTHAAVNETVDLVKQRGNRGVAGFVNANLRAIAQKSWAEWLDAISAAMGDALGATAMAHAHPRWIAKAFHQALQRENRADDLEALLGADNIAPAVHLVALPGHAMREEVTAAHPDRCTELEMVPTAMQLRGGNPHDVIDKFDGAVRVQDAGSQLAAFALAHAPVAVSATTDSSQTHCTLGTESWLDLCAGPGGKSAYLAAHAQLLGAQFLANEVTPARAGLVRQALAPLGSFDVLERDGREIGADYPAAFDRILADVPCSGLGALRRRPEARWRKSRSDINELVVLQHQLLDSAIRACKPGGVIAYVTCSPVVEETTNVINGALATGAVRALDTVAVLSDAGSRVSFTPIVLDTVAHTAPDGATTGGNAVQCWPHLHGTDAMFIALLQRVNDPVDPR
ncbi:RsmB/NOP family class I SAM-dependent RNA methyltransferase [Gulosibacter bifidus]|uniref:RsmB/NOP family class I SAM-dependent RNA methyltransferase n=1 Tax=Gulosibacter bifidus TaxID=272239 RepID=A0ABW5RFK5_9MICO|nr:transcription antitermination factor NusB [Gulosibacter bifidus]